MDMLRMAIGRRQCLSLGASAATIALLPRFAVAAASQADTRFLLVFLRGGMDGLHALQPLGDPAFAGLRGSFLASGKQPTPHRLDSTFALHGALGFMAELHARKQLLPVAAVAPPYTRRSHFEAQDCGRVAGDWPGVAKAQLNDGRDLRAATDMRSVFKGVLGDHMGIADAALGRSVFPDSSSILPMRDLVRSA